MGRRVLFSPHLFELPAKRFRPKINCRRVGWTRFTIEIDRLAVFIVQVGRPIEDKIDWRCKLLRIFQRSFKLQVQISSCKGWLHTLILFKKVLFIRFFLFLCTGNLIMVDHHGYECFDTFVTEKFISNWLMNEQKKTLWIFESFYITYHLDT